MDSISRLKQIIELGLPVYLGNHYLTLLRKEESRYGGPKSRLVGVFPDGAKEFAYVSGYNRSCVSPSHKRRMRELLKQENLKLGKGSTLYIDLHVLEMLDGQAYEFFLPGLKHFEL